MTLRDELQQDPLALGYAGMDAPQILDSLKARTRTRIVSRMVTARAILSDCANGAAILDKLETAAANISAVKWAMYFLKQEAGIDAGSSATRTMISQLHAGGILTQAEADSLLALGVSSCSRIEELGLPDPILADVMEAMK